MTSVHRSAFAILTMIALTTSFAGLAHGQEVRSIRQWVTGDGKTDDTAGVARAFAACRNNAFILSVDCPVFIHVGSDIVRPVFIDNGTHVQFTNNGLFITDNQYIPAFVVANSSDISLLKWQVEYVGGLSVEKNTQPAFQFNDITMTEWLHVHRNISFNTHGKNGTRSTNPWQSPTNTAAVFYFIGSVKDVVIDQLRMFVPPDAGGEKFIPMAFSFGHGYESNQTATPLPNNDNNLWVTLPNISVPSHIKFTNVTLDGYYMGFQGVVKDITFDKITGLRYGDLQDSSGGNVGGVGKWFAPPHLFYIKYENAKDEFNPRLSVTNLRISNVNDIGPRVGTARDTVDRSSGFACSLKVGAIDSSVTNYVSNRPDGLADILSSRNLTLTNITGTYDSSFVNDMYPGVRFPADNYENVTFNSLTLTDLSNDPYAHGDQKATDSVPIGGRPKGNANGITFNNVVVNLKRWSRAYDLQPRFGGSNNHTRITVNVQQ